MAAYIAFEGSEGSGKSTQAALLAERVDAVLTREPGGTPLGLALRSLLLGEAASGADPKGGAAGSQSDFGGGPALGSRAEALMMAADRAQHLEQLVMPALEKGWFVVSDRSAYSSLAYQGVGRGLGVEAVRAVNEFAVEGRWPDVVVYLQVPFGTSTSRLNRPLDRIEQAGEEFHRRVHDAFDELAAAEPDRFVVVDGLGSRETVADRVWQALTQRVAGLASVAGP